MKSLKVPCSQCGKMMLIPETRVGFKNYCDKFCKNRSRMQKLRGGVTKKPRPKQVHKCRSCGR